MKTRIWDLPVRLTHLVFILGFAGAYILADEGTLNLHTAFGIAFFIMILFRIIYGFSGSRYARFSDFPMSISNVKSMLKNFRESHTKYLGHNPIASYVMLGIIILGLCTGITGLMNLSVKQAVYPFTTFGESEILEEVHEIFANILLVFVGFHLLGLITDIIILKGKTSLFSMINGNKPIEGESSKTKPYQLILAIIFLIVSAFAFYNNATNTALNEKDKQEQLEQDED